MTETPWSVSTVAGYWYIPLLSPPSYFNELKLRGYYLTPFFRRCAPRRCRRLHIVCRSEGKDRILRACSRRGYLPVVDIHKTSALP